MIHSFVIDFEMYKEIRSNVIDRLVGMAGKKHGVALLEGGKQQTQYEGGEVRILFLIYRY